MYARQLAEHYVQTSSMPTLLEKLIRQVSGLKCLRATQSRATRQAVLTNLAPTPQAWKQRENGSHVQNAES